MKNFKIENVEIKNIEFEHPWSEGWSDVYCSSANIELLINGKFTVFVNNVIVDPMSGDTFADFLMNGYYQLDEETAYEKMWDDEYKDYYNDLSEMYAKDIIEYLIYEDWDWNEGFNYLNTLNENDENSIIVKEAV